MKLRITISIVLVTVCLFISAAAQTPAVAEQNFTGENLKFKYPAGWKLKDLSSEQFQQLNLVPEKGSAFIIITAYRGPIPDKGSKAFEQLKQYVVKPYIENISKGFMPLPATTDVCTEMQTRKITGFRLSGVYHSKESVNDVYSFMMDDRFFNLIYMRTKESSAATDPGWETILNSLRTFEGSPGTLPRISIDGQNSRILNGRAIKLPRPYWPLAARSFPIKEAEIEVEVVIDKSGTVTYAKAVSGYKVFAGEAEAAAKKAKFKPTEICGEPIEVTGIIVYNFSRW